jgi:hypothetical protein
MYKKKMPLIVLYSYNTHILLTNKIIVKKKTKQFKKKKKKKLMGVNKYPKKKCIFKKLFVFFTIILFVKRLWVL